MSISGLPASSYIPGKKYDFSLTVTHAAADRKRWGFSIVALDASGNPIGQLSSTNANASNNGSELSHFNAVITAAQSSYTYSNLHWIAPAVAGQTINLYFVGNAANSANGNQGDYIYSNTATIALPLVLKDFTATSNGSDVQLNWHAAQEINSNFFGVEKSVDGQIFYNINNVYIANSNVSAYSFTDVSPSYYGRPIFYRLKQVDRDGKFKYSPVVSVTLKTTGLQISKVSPSFFKSGSIVTAQVISDKNEQLQILLLDAGGRLVQKTTQNVTIGNNDVRFSVNTLQKGILYAKFVSSGFSQTIPLFVN